MISYGLKEFVGMSGDERDFANMVKASVVGIRKSGHVLISALTDNPVEVRVSYIEEHRHLVFQDLSGPRYKALGAVDLSDVDVSVKPGVSVLPARQEGSMEAELQRAKRLRDKELITEGEYSRMKAEVINKWQ